MKTFFVICEQTCPKCSGEKYLDNPFYNSECPDEFRKKQDEWMEKVGGTGLQSLMPAKELICDECKGDGVVRQEVDLKTAIQEIGAMGYWSY